MMEKMILVDLETQDFRVETGIYEVACMVIEDDQIVETLYLPRFYVNPPHITLYASIYNG